MRLRTLYEKIEMELPHIEGIKLTIVANNNSARKIERYGESIKCLQNLSKLIYIDDIIQDLDKKGLFRLGTSVSMQSSEADSYIVALNNVIGRCETIKSLINDHVPKDDEKSIIVKLPTYEYYSEFASSQIELAHCFKLLKILPGLEKEPTLSNFDVGSDWIRIIFDTFQAAANFATVITAVIQFNKQRIDKKLSELAVLSLQIDPDTRNKVQEAMNKETLSTYTALAKEINKKIKNEDVDPEDIQKLVKSLQALSDILYSGMSFHAPITKDSTNPFSLPAREEQNNLPESGKAEAQKLIANKHKDN